MSYKLDPRIVSKLRAFAQRRRKLILIRGLAAGFAMLLATMLVVAAIDRFFLLEDWQRWTLSGIAYLAVILTEWRSCLRLLAYAPGPRQLARLVEHAEPKLREDLISAVELGTPEGEKVFDSPQFRGLLQQDVAARMDGMEVERLLPVQLVRRYLLVAAAITVAVVALFVVTGFQLGSLFLRALMPGANLDRVSATKVEVLGPNPAEMLVPHGDAVPLLVKISGAPAREAWLETFTETEGRQKVKLTPLGGDQFSGAIQVGREDLRYRVRAGDAITKKYLLDAEPRPHVVKFTKTYRLPAYAKAEPRTVTEEAGDLIALEGTEVDLVLEPNQPIQAAELRLEQGVKNSQVMPLTAKDGKLTATVPLTASGSYRVHLVAAKTGFENKFSPEFELRAEPDLVPQIEIDQPKQDLILPANDLVDIIGHASDDIGLAKVEQHIRVNEGGWKKVPLLGEAGLKAGISHRWDLYAQGAKPGDLLTTKLVAFDLKGNRGESRPLQITVTAAGVEMKRLESLDAFVALHDSLKLWRASLEALAKSASEARQRFEQTGDTDPQRRVALTALAAAQTDFERQHSDTAAVLATALRAAQPGHQGADLVVIGRMLAKTEAGTARLAKTAAAVAAQNPAAPHAREVMREADDAANRAVQRARALDDAFRTVLSSEEADLLAENAQIVQREQARLGELAGASGDDPAKWTALNGRVRVALSEIKSLEDILARLGERGLGGSDRARSLAKELKKQREEVDRAIAERGVTKDSLKPLLKLTEGVARVEKSALELRQDLAQRPLQILKDLRQDNQPAWANFERLAADLEAAQNAKLPEEARSLVKASRWELRRDLFKTHGDMEEIRPLSDALFVGDLRAATVALESFMAVSAGETLAQSRERLLGYDRAFRLIESAHDLTELHDGLGQLTISERWQAASPRARTAAPRDWAWLEIRLRQAPDELGRLQLNDEPVRQAIQGAQQILWNLGKLDAFRDLYREMNERRKPEYQPVTHRAESETLAAEVKRALDLLRPHVEAARQQLAQLTPKLSELAKALAKETGELKQETQKQEEAAKEKAPEQAKADAEKALAQQEKLNEKVETLKDLLRAEANKQNVLEAEGREKARDADDALAMLKEPPPKAANALDDAAKAETKSAQEQALAQAAEQQHKLEQALNQIAAHQEAVEQGKDLAATRADLRAMEAELGIKQELDQQYAKAEQLAQLAQSSPQEMLKQLEQALPQNPQMQQELSSISQNTVAQAQQKLSEAARAEEQVAQNLQAMAQQQEKGQSPAQAAMEAAQKAAEAAEAARQAANDAVQTAKQADNQAAADQARQARSEAQDAVQAAEKAMKAAEKMAERMADGKSAEQVAKAAQQTAEKAAEAAQNAQEAMQAAKQAQATAQQAAQQKNDQQASNQQSAQQAGEAAQKAEQAVQAAMQAQAAAEQAAAMAQAEQNQPADAQNPQMAQNNPQGQPVQSGQPQAQNQSQPQAQASQPENAQNNPSATPANPPQSGQPMAAPQNPQLAQAQRQQQPIAQAAAEAGAEVARAGRHEERLQNTQAGQQLQQLGAEIAETAMNEVPAAQQALAQAQMAAQAQQPVNAAAQELAAEAGQLAQAAQMPSQPTPAQQGEMAQSGQPPQAGQPASPSSSPPQNAQAGQPQNAQAGQPPAGQPQPGQAPSGQPQASPAPAQPGQMAATPLSPAEQTWMARTLDALDAALNSPTPSGEAAPPGEPGQPGQQTAQQGQPGQQTAQQGQPQPPGQPGQPQAGQQGQPQPGQPGENPAMAQAQAAMQQAAQAAQQAMAQARSQNVTPSPSSLPKAEGTESDKSMQGALAQVGDLPYGATPDAKGLKAGDWGKLPKQMAEQLSRGQSEAVPAEYRSQVETYYRVIAERAKKQ
jgi:hypothetical protein